MNLFVLGKGEMILSVAAGVTFDEFSCHLFSLFALFTETRG